MRNRTITIAILLFLCTTALVTAQQRAADLFRQGSAKEQVGDCEGAIPLYERIVREFTSVRDREQVARAKLHLGDCFIKKTRADQSKGMAYLDDVVTNYKQWTDLVNEANRLKALSRPAVRSDAPLQIPTPFTDDPFSFAISPDGKWLVLQATTDEGKMLWRQPADGSKKAVPVAGTEGAGQFALPFFSPDGQSFGFFADGKLKRVSVNGGIPQDIVALPSFRGGAWNKDDVIVFGDGRLGLGLDRIRADGSERRHVSTPFGWYQNSPKFLADSLRFLFAVSVRSDATLSLGALDGSARSAIQPTNAEAAAFARPDRMVYVAGGVLTAQRLDPLNVNAVGDSIRLAERVALNRTWPGIAALSVSDAGPLAYRSDTFAKRQFMWVDRKGGLIRTLGLRDAESPSSARISPDGKSVAFNRSVGSAVNGSMWAMDVETGAMRQLFNWAGSAVWSPNTTDKLGRMVFGEMDPKSLVMDLVDRNGVRKELKNVNDRRSVTIKALDWSSKDVLLYLRNPVPGLPDLFALPSGGGVPVVVAGTPFSERNGRFSPDGDWVAYQSNELDARDEVFVQPFPGSTNERKRVSLNGGTFPHWSSDGQQLYFLSADNQLMTVPASRSANGQGIALGPATALFALVPGAEFEVSADGNRFLINAPTEVAPPIFVLSNWVDKLPAASSSSTSSPLVASTPVAPDGRPTRYGAQTQIVVFDRQRQILSTVKETGPNPRLSISPDGTRVAYLHSGDIKVIDIATGIEAVVASNTLNGPPPSWSPDGRRIAYFANRSGVQGVYAKSSNGTGNEELLYPAVGNVFNWSKDGRFLAIATGTNFAVLPVEGDRKPISIMPTAGIAGLRLAPDSRFVAYVSNESGINEVYVRSFDPASGAQTSGAAAKRKVSTQGSPGLIRWSGDGKELYYLASDGGLMVVSDASATAFEEQSSTLLFPVPDNFPLTGAPGIFADISPDGQRFVFALPASTNAGR